MNALIRRWGLSLWLCLASSTAFAFDTQQLAQLLNQPRSIHGQFEQQRHLKSLSKPLSSQGQFTLVPKKGLLWQMHSPLQSTLKVSPNGISQRNAQGQWLPSRQNSSAQQQVRLFLDLLGGNTEGLQRQFDLRLSGNANNWQLQLLPKSTVLKQVFNRIDIRGNQLVRQIELSEAQGDKTIIRFNSIKTNQPFTALERDALAP